LLEETILHQAFLMICGYIPLNFLVMHFFSIHIFFAITTIIIVAFLVIGLIIIKHKKVLSLAQERHITLEKKLAEIINQTTIQVEEKQKFDLEKNKINEKNKKIWQMTEAVYVEKKKVDEEVELLKKEKDLLETEKKKVDEKVKKLWSQSMAIHKEKEKINELKVEIEIKHREVIDSVNYAKRIQEAVLPSLSEIERSFPQSFVLFKPRDIVSGDFYWFSEKENAVIIASIDCTGHGVPGAFMSLIGNTLLNHIVNEKGVTDPAEILNHLNKEVNFSLRQSDTGSQSRDGMDVALCVFEKNNQHPIQTLKYAGANRPLYIVSSGELKEVKADKFPIGGWDNDTLKSFTTHVIDLQENTAIYIASDGYADQFGQNDKKLKTKKFKEMLLEIQSNTMPEQKSVLDNYIESWKGNQEQTDDILVIGIRV
jgi:serine phosphatase RsbU (regulator of sigma subunit)